MGFAILCSQICWVLPILSLCALSFFSCARQQIDSLSSSRGHCATFSLSSPHPRFSTFHPLVLVTGSVCTRCHVFVVTLCLQFTMFLDLFFVLCESVCQLPAVRLAAFVAWNGVAFLCLVCLQCTPLPDRSARKREVPITDDGSSICECARYNSVSSRFVVVVILQSRAQLSCCLN